MQLTRAVSAVGGEAAMGALTHRPRVAEVETQLIAAIVVYAAQVTVTCKQVNNKYIVTLYRARFSRRC